MVGYTPLLLALDELGHLLVYCRLVTTVPVTPFVIYNDEMTRAQ
jgi:hypothetical protein